jgi:hypothetical protein
MANIITPAEYYDYDDSPSPVANADQIAAAITAATARIANLTGGRTFEIANNPSPVDEVEILPGNGTSRIYTTNAPITAVSLVEYWDGTQWVEYDSVTYPYAFKLDSNIVYFTQGHKFVKGYENNRVTYEYGFASAMPENLKHVCYLLAKHFVDQTVRQGLTSQRDGEQTFTYNTKLESQVMPTITRYKTRW